MQKDSPNAVAELDAPRAGAQRLDRSLCEKVPGAVLFCLMQALGGCRIAGGRLQAPLGRVPYRRSLTTP